MEYSSIGGGGSFSNADKTGLGSTMEIGSVHTMVWRFPVTESRRLIVPWKDSIWCPRMTPLEPCRAISGFLIALLEST